MAAIFVLVGCIALVLGAPTEVRDLDHLMPDVQPKVADTYLCKAMQMSDVEQYIVGFHPHANMTIAHHMLLYGCESPGQAGAVWNCGEMASTDGDGFNFAPVCSRGSKIIYAWAMDAPSLDLPEDVGFRVGGTTTIRYLVLQVHYKDVTSFLPPVNGKDRSGITMRVQDQPTGKLAGVYVMATGGSIPPHETVYMETACAYKSRVVIHPFAFRTHAHSLGQVISGYRVRNGQWAEIGRRSPKDPEMFYVTSPGMTIRYGDALAARCTMKNDQDRTVYVGSTQNDEMCNFYIMYFVDGQEEIRHSSCFSAGPPTYFWKYDTSVNLNTDAIPDTASLIPGTQEPLMMTSLPDVYP